ncbi:hypothetical protein ACFVH0_31970 [Streptomyces sp. NPDC127117]|uniref:hypothetical protein n=1 Tax=Streptomyces sp. NPDC127117 TaxID=3345368 RepID=UPI003639BA37
MPTCPEWPLFDLVRHLGERRRFRATAVAAGPAAAPPARPAPGTAGDLVLAMHGRIPAGTLKLDGDRRLFDQLLAWDPDEQGMTGRRERRPAPQLGPPPLTTDGSVRESQQSRRTVVEQPIPGEPQRSVGRT